MSNPTVARSPRYWCRREGTFRSDSHGFLLDPEGPSGRSLNPELVELTEEDGRDCLVLLGEPGMGKSTVLAAESDRWGVVNGTTGDVLVGLDLGEYGDESRLIRELFETPEWDHWRSGDRTLNLHLDGLDECRLQLPNVVKVVLGRLRKLPRLDRLKLRITCRTGAWPHHLEEGLRSLWPEDRTGVLELMPLRRRDVAEIAAGSGLQDVDAFFGELERRNAGPLAAKPVTLKLLLNLYKRGGLLPRTQAELYELGCRALCEEANDARLATRNPGLLDVEQRFAVAARVASATVFCNRSAIWDGPDLADRPDDDITVSGLSGGAEKSRGAAFAVTEAGIREVLSETGLFSSRGPRRMGWAHRTFAEYLAARYLVVSGLGVDQIRSLILHPHAPGKVVPQLQQAAAWLAGMVPEVFRMILAADPAVLVLSDVENTATDDREALVAALLRATSEGRLGDRGLDLMNEYRKLKHPRLASQLDPYLTEKSEGLLTRRLAIDLARACEVRDLQGRLADVVLDRSEDMTIRVEAGYAVWLIGDVPTRRRLRPLLAPDLDEDIEDQLKGCALKSLWPGLIDAEEVFRILSDQKRENFHGPCAGFLSSDLVRGLSAADLPTALAWAAARGSTRRLPYLFGSVIDQIVLRAWDEIERPGIADVLIQIVWDRIQDHESMTAPFSQEEWSARLGADPARRRRLVRALVSRPAAASMDVGQILYFNPPLVTAEDLPWLIGLLDTEGDSTIRTALARIIRAAFLWIGPHSLDEVLAAAERHPELADTIRALIDPIALDSPQADAARNYHSLSLSRAVNSQAPWVLDPPPKVRVEQFLDRGHAGDLDAWWRLTLAMTLKPTSTDYDEESRSDLTATPGWREADEFARSRILDAAHRYLLGARPSPDEWFFEEGATYRPDEAAFKALRLLREQAAERFDALGPDTWSKWAPAIVGYPNFGRADDQEAQRRLIFHAYQHAPGEVLDWLARWLVEQDRRDHPMISARLWADLPATALTGIFMDRVRDRSTKIWVMGTLLDDLLARGSPEAREFAISLIGPPLPADPELSGRSLAAARSLLTFAPDAGWPALWPVFREIPEFGRDLVTSVAPGADRADTAPFLARLTEAQLAEFYTWLARQFPHDEDEKHEGFHVIGSREYVARFRDGVLRHLERRGTPAALDAIGEIAQRLPHLSWLPLVRLQAEKVMMERSWTPFRPEDLWALVKDRETRLVDGGDQLLDVVAESLRRFERKLQGETPASFMLWDKQGDGRYRPKEEERLSDALKLHLKTDLVERGIVANREVVIRPGSGGRAGERTDIYVDAITQGPRPGVFDCVTVVIEVKGCWHREVLVAMRDQLRGRYLTGGACRHGLYVVGWFHCDQWDTSDYRRDDARRLIPASLAEARALFTTQAEEMSVGDRRIGSLVINCALP